MGLFDVFRSSTYADADPPDEVRSGIEDLPIETQFDLVVADQILGSLDPETLPAVYAATDLIASSIARLVLEPETPLSRRPDPFLTRGDFYFETGWSLASRGDAYWLQTRTPRGVDSLEVVSPSSVQARFTDGSRRRREYTVDGTPVDRSRITHLRFHPRPGEVYGLSPIEASRTTWGGAVAAERWGARLFAKSGIPSGVLAAEYEITPAEAIKLRADWDKARNGERSTAVLGGGVTYKGIELSPADLAWLDFRSATALDVARMFHIPADLLEVALEGSSLTYQNLAEVGADFVRWCLDAYLTIIAEAFGSLPGEPGDRRFDTRPLYTASAETRARTLNSLVSSGADFDSAAEAADFPTLTASTEETADV